MFNAILNLLDNNQHYRLNRSLLKHLRSVDLTFFLTVLLDRFRYFEMQPFYWLREEITETLYMDKKTISKYIQTLQDMGLVTVVVKGLPARNYFSFTEENQAKLIKIFTEKSPIIEPTNDTTTKPENGSYSRPENGSASNIYNQIKENQIKDTQESISEDRYQETPIPPLPPHSGLTSEHIIGVSPFGVSQDKNLSANNLVSKPSCDMKKDNTLFASRFDRFYSAYPKKKGKEGAKRAFMKLKADEGLLLQIIKAIEKQRQSPDWLKSNGDYIPYPSTWLNGKRWEDEDDSPNANSEGDYLPGYDWRKEEDKRMQREWEESKQRFQEGLRASGLDEVAYMAMLKAQAVENLRIEQEKKSQEQKERERRNTTNANE